MQLSRKQESTPFVFTYGWGSSYLEDSSENRYTSLTMHRLFLSFLTIATILSPLPVGAFAYNPNLLVSDEEMLDTDTMSRGQIQAFLEARGGLGELVTTDVNGEVKRASDIIFEAAQEFELNPQFLLALLQREQSLVDADNPTERQLAWAMGYAVCDDCSKEDPLIQKFKGFGNQVHYAAKRIRNSYLADLASRGFTVSGIGPGITTTINGTAIVPANHATAALYTYTPHLHGNANFVKIWQRWFTRDYPTGSLLQDSETGAVWLIQYGVRRPITSRATLLSRFNPENIISVKPASLEAYPAGRPIQFPNYSLLRSPLGTVYLLVGETKRGFTSQEAFRALGFVEDEVIDASFEDLSAFEEGEPINAGSADPVLELVQNTKTGAVFALENGEKKPIVSRTILLNHFAKPTFKPLSEEALLLIPEGLPLQFQDGTLVQMEGRPDVYVISEGKRRPITSEQAFLAYGWSWKNIIVADSRSVELHEIGLAIETPDELSDESSSDIASASLTL